MKKFLALSLFISLFVPQSDAQELIQLSPITLEKTASIQDIKNLSAAVSNMSLKVMDCMKTGRSNAECQCVYLAEAKNYQTVLAETLIKHPEWKDGSTYYATKNEEGRTVMGTTTSFKGHQMQSQAIDNLSCSQGQ